MSLSIRLLAPRTALAIVLLIVVAGVGVQTHHRLVRAHFAPVGLHLDVVVRDEARYGGPIRFYYAEMTNFGLWPTSFVACKFTTDTNSPGTEFAWGLQRWDVSKSAWQTMSGASARENFCDLRPVPTSRGWATVSRDWVWPGNTREMAEEAVGHRGDFTRADSVRFVVFRTLSDLTMWETAVFSKVFRIERDVIREDGSIDGPIDR
jgi:hypothetical protein